MSQIDDFYSMMESDKNYVDNFVLETHEGTKRLKEKFHLNASLERNNYIEKKIIDYNNSLMLFCHLWLQETKLKKQLQQKTC